MIEPLPEEKRAEGVDAELESELADLRESVRRGTEQADAGQVVPAGEVFEELRQRNASLTKLG